MILNSSLPRQDAAADSEVLISNPEGEGVVSLVGATGTPLGIGEGVVSEPPPALMSTDGVEVGISRLPETRRSRLGGRTRCGESGGRPPVPSRHQVGPLRYPVSRLNASLFEAVWHVTTMGLFQPFAGTNDVHAIVLDTPRTGPPSPSVSDVHEGTLLKM